ncbi:uncharacterized protein EI90DRAFT_3055462 [Cantharellus anzutake]|uniref:uncharacterized protein n=1 Tax=Cantharellus anzutake TaxID=1750568 RepID=UPI001907B966|nr:uncharacterized protein EI90DRAFT_3055462 [Cantharellus anzutake]KAF8332383.1 hypothetical protein EI90DRAFT_3055462 [Cantharellus anzutake]
MASLPDDSVNHSFQESVNEVDALSFVSRVQASPIGEAVDDLERVVEEMKEHGLNYGEFMSAICEEILRLEQPTAQEERANEDVLLFGRSFSKITRPDSSIVENPQEQAAHALAHLQATVNKLCESELFTPFPPAFRGPPPTYSPGDGFDSSGSSGRVQGGGGISGPSELDTINLAKLLEECAAPPSLLTRLPSDSTSGLGIPQSPTSVSTTQQSYMTTGSPESAGATDTTRA